MALKDKLPTPILPPQSRQEVWAKESYRALATVAEMMEAGEELYAVQPAVCIYGSARTSTDHEDYQFTERLARKLSDAGFSVISGGGPGIMEAANKGAYAGRSPSVGVNITLPHEQHPNAYQDLSLRVRRFFVRKAIFTDHSIACVVMPGGFGTLDEMVETLMLVQTGKAEKRPIILVGSAFWQGLLDWMKAQMLPRHFIDEHNMDFLELMDSEDEIVERIFRQYHERGHSQTRR